MDGRLGSVRGTARGAAGEGDRGIQIGARRRARARHEHPTQRDVPGLAGPGLTISVQVGKRGEGVEGKPLDTRTGGIANGAPVARRGAGEVSKARGQLVLNFEIRQVDRRAISNFQRVAYRFTGFDPILVGRQPEVDREARVVVQVRHSDVRRVPPVVTCVGAGRSGRHDGVRHVAIHAEVVHPRDRHRLRSVPVPRREREGRRSYRPLAWIARGEPDRHARRGLGIEHHGERAGPARFGRRQAGGRRHGDPREVVVRIRHPNVRWVQPVVAPVGAGRGGRHDRVSHVAIDPEVVHTRDRHRLRRVPVPRREREGRRSHRPLGQIARREPDRHIRRRLTCEHYGERRRPAPLRRCQARGRCHSDRRRVVIRIRHPHVRRVHPVVDPVRAGRRSSHDRVGDAAIDPEVICPRDRHRLRRAPVPRREREGRRTHRPLAWIAR